MATVTLPYYQISYMGKFWFLSYELVLSQSDCRILEVAISQEKINESI